MVPCGRDGGSDVTAPSAIAANVVAVWRGVRRLYAKNYMGKPSGIGFPTRMPYALFPFVFFWVAAFFERVTPGAKKGRLLAVYLAVQTGVILPGVALDSGGHMNVGNLWQEVEQSHGAVRAVRAAMVLGFAPRRG